MTNIKRTTQSKGNSRRTTTLSSTGTKTESYSNKPSKSSPRRTVSYNHKTGKTRTTYSQKLGGGWTSIRTKTHNTLTKSRPRKTKPIPLSFPLLFFGSILLMGMYLWPATAPYIIGIVLMIGLIVFIFSILHYIVWGAILLGIIYLISLFL